MAKPLLPTLSKQTFLAGLTIISLGALLLRVVPLYDSVIRDDVIRFQGIDAHYHIRLSTYVAEHYPDRLAYDPLRRYPSGQRVDVYPAFDLVNATASVIAGLGSPKERTIQIVTAWMPPILGALTVFLLGMAGYTLAGPWAGLAAASLPAFIPGGTLAQTLIGFSDHHALESFLLAACWLLLLMLSRRPQETRRSLLLWVLLGIGASGYCLSWEGSPALLVTIAGIVGVWTLIEKDPSQLVDLARGAATFTMTVIITLAIVHFSSSMIWVSVVLACVVPILPLLKRMLEKIIPDAHLRTVPFVWALVICVILIVAYTALPEEVMHTLGSNIGRMTPSQTARTVSELRPLIADLPLLWDYSGPAPAWAVAEIVLCIVLLRKRRDRSLVVPLIVGAVFVPAALMQIRFAASSSLAYGLLSALLVGWISAEQGPLIGGSRRSGKGVRWLVLLLWTASVPAWSVSRAPDVARSDRGPSPDWTSAMTWIRGNTPEQLTNGKLSYGILNWWDAGYYLVSMANRAPFSNPTQSGARPAARFYLDTSGTKVIERLRARSFRYILTDAILSVVPVSAYSIEGKFPALPVWAERVQGEFFRVVYFRDRDGSLEPRYAFLPSYFKALHTRLLLYDGKNAVPKSGTIWVIRTAIRQDPIGGPLEVVEASQTFATYDPAAAFLAEQNDPSWFIVSFSPFDTCVPLDELPGVRRVYASPTIALAAASLPEPVSVVKMFELLPVPTTLPGH